VFYVTITKALQIAQRVPATSPKFLVKLACGFTPLHLQTFLTAHLQERVSDRKVSILPGLYGDLAGTLESLSNGDGDAPDALAVVLEWMDLDPRLGFRNSGAWSTVAVADIVSSARAMLQRIAGALSRVPAGVRIAVLLPSLPLPPLFHTSGWQASEEELTLQRDLLAMAAELAHGMRVVVVNGQRLSESSPAAGRFDLKSDLLTGLPYTLPHADEVAAALTVALQPPAPKKAIISDLDDTRWNGIVGEVGAEGVAWDLAGHAQLHGLYQKTLASLSENGVLVGIASKNDPAVVKKAFERTDLLISSDRIFPFEVHWEAKSGSVSRILQTWNIGADSVIFVDDSPMELAEVAAAHPGIECILFPKNDYAAGLALLRRLRDLCGKERISKEDTLRLDSIRRSAEFQQQSSGGSASEEFLRQLNAALTFDFACGSDSRTLELINKTNQFNLNGVRLTEADWQKRLAQPGAFVVGISYEDKFGMLGTIAVVQGVVIPDTAGAGGEEGAVLQVATWVMSCRAFARRIEHRVIEVLFEHYQASRIEFEFIATPKNGPVQDFLTAIQESGLSSPVRITRQQFQTKCPSLYHTVYERVGELKTHG
jgi:FkbH-like protein